MNFRFERRLGHFLFHTYFPTIIIVVVSWFSFWMKPEDVTERVMLGVTSLLTIFAQHSISGQSVPPVAYLKVRLKDGSESPSKLSEPSASLFAFRALNTFVFILT